MDRGQGLGQNLNRPRQLVRNRKRTLDKIATTIVIFQVEILECKCLLLWQEKTLSHGYKLSKGWLAPSFKIMKSPIDYTQAIEPCNFVPHREKI